MGREKLDPNNFNDDAIRDLGYAICIQAALDYKKSVDDDLRKKEHKPGIEDRGVYERFFKSEWFKELSGINNTDGIAESIRKNKDKKLNVFDAGI